MNIFTISHRDHKARTGILKTSHATIDTPCFMPVATNTAIKGVINKHLTDTNIILNNILHLILRDAIEPICNFSGIHEFIGWDKAILTDSGGYQVFSMANIIKKSSEGVLFKSPWNGSHTLITPEISIAAQCQIGVDIAMSFDDCTSTLADTTKIYSAVERSNDWAERGKRQFLESNKNSLLFGIIQGGLDYDLRIRSLDHLLSIGFDGYAFGGLALGESIQKRNEILDRVGSCMHEESPRYLMGVGTPVDIVQAVRRGIDMFDCVLPTRNARNGYLFTSNGPVRIKNNKYRNSTSALDDNCDCYTCKNYSLSYLRYIYQTKEINAITLLTIHNLHYYEKVMKNIRLAISQGTFEKFSEDFIINYKKCDNISRCLKP